MPAASLLILRRYGPLLFRLSAVVLSLALSFYGLLYGVAGLIGVGVQATGLGGPMPAWMLPLNVLIAHAWIAWLVLGLAWAFQRRLHPWWPISGTIVGIICVVATLGFAIVFTFPAIIMASVFAAFQLSDEARKIEAARQAARGPRRGERG